MWLLAIAALSSAPPSGCSPRCPCRAANAATLLKKTSEQTSAIARTAGMGVVNREELDEATTTANAAKDVLLGMHTACAAACAKGCRGCRVARLLNQTLTLQRGVDEAVELGYFVDDERTMTTLPDKLSTQAALAKTIALSLHNLGSRCPPSRGTGSRGSRGMIAKGGGAKVDR